MTCKDFLFLAVAAFSLVACSSTPNAPEWDGVSCPDIGAVTVAADYVNDADLVHSTIGKVRGACLVKDGVIDVDLYVDTDSENLGGIPETKIRIPVFTAVLDAGEQPLDKKMHTIEIVLPPTGKVALQTHTINVRFPMKDTDKNPNNYHFVVGFQLGE